MSRYIYLVQLQYSSCEDTCIVFTSRSVATDAFLDFRVRRYPGVVAVFLCRAHTGFSCGSTASIINSFCYDNSK